MAAGTYVTVRNLWDRPVKLGYDSEKWEIEPKASAIVPKIAAIIAFGDWEARPGVKQFDPEGKKGLLHETREFEYARVRGHYGCSEGATIERDGQELPADTLLDEMLPKVEIEEMDGSVAITVIDDPEGKGLPIEGGSTIDAQRLLATIEAQQKAHAEEIEKLKRQAFNLHASNEELPDEDDPSKAPKRRGKAKVEGAQMAEISASLDD